MEKEKDGSERANKRRKVENEVVPDSEEEDEYDSYDADEDWDEVLASEEASNKAAEAIFSPSQHQSQQHRPPSQRQSASLSPLKARTDAGERDATMAMLLVDEEDGNKQNNEKDNDEDHEEDAKRLAYEAAIAARYSTILQGFAARFPDQAQQHENNETSHVVEEDANMANGPDTPAAGARQRPPLVPSTVSFTSARGKTFAPPSEAALRKAREFEAALLDDRADAEQDHKAGSSTGRDDTDGNTETPLLIRTGVTAGAGTGMTGRGMSAFRPPSRATSASTGSRQQTHQLVDTPTAAPVHRAIARPGLDPLRYALQNANANANAHANVAAAGIQGAGGFTSGSGAVVSMPSKADAEARMRSLESNKSGEQGTPSVVARKNMGLTLGGGGAFSMPSKANLEKDQNKMQRGGTDPVADMGDSVEGSGPTPFGLVTGSGKALKPPSKEAVARTAAMLSGTQPAPGAEEKDADEFDDLGNDEDDEDLLAATAAAEEQIGALRASQLGQGQGQGQAGFTSGSGAAVTMPDKEALKRAEALLDGSKSDAASSGVSTPGRPVLHAKNSNTMAVGSPLRNAQQNAAQKRSLLTGGALTNTTTPNFRQAFKPPSTITRPGTAFAPATPTRTAGLAASTQVGSVRATQMVHPQLNLLMSPRNTPQTAPKRSTFTPPFKDGIRPSASRLQELKHKSLEGTVPPGTLVGTAPSAVIADLEEESVAPAMVNGNEKGKGKGKKQAQAGKDSVFDVYSTKSEPRQNMVEYGIDPSYRVTDLIDAGLPPALIFLTFEKCETHRFDIGQGDTLGHEDAFEELVYYNACKGISLAWVKNHYTLIVWKLAGIAKGLAHAGGWREWWTFERVCEQLKYRYEREVLLSQRSCIKRITERDSGPKAPMVLVVTRIIYEQRDIPPEPGSNEAIQGIPRTATYPYQIELSDGWYRIRSSLLANDDSLYRAVFYNKIYSGLKIAIQGAKLDSESSDGAEPLEAYESCKLTITGNSTVRVPWYTTLGLQPRRKQPCVCSFRSLLPDGGFVPFVDVLLTKLYPIGYKGAYVEGQTTDTWGETEEAERKRAWERERDKIIHDIQIEQQTAQMELRVIQQILTEQLSLVSHRDPSAAKPEPLTGLSDFSDVYQKLEEEPEKRSVILKTLDKELLEETLQHAQRKAESFAYEGADAMRKEVEERCPPRVAKSFRIARLQDYSHGAATADGANYNNRDCQLQITDLQKMAPGFLAEGKRYIVSNLYPTNTNAWSRPDSKSGEILLCTRYDTKWFPRPL